MARLGWSYGPAMKSGYWGEVNSHWNFCEEDYTVTHYAAELVGTVTNLIYIVYAIVGIRWNRHYGGTTTQMWVRNLPCIGLICVGIGSMLFHISMKYYMQWADDLSMLIAVGIVCVQIWTYDKTEKETAIIGGSMAVGLSLFSVWHCYTDETTMHSVVFAVMMLANFFRGRHIIKTRIQDPLILSDLKKLNGWGALIFATGYGIWNLDHLLCPQLIVLRRMIGMPLSFLLEFHGWWHIFTGIGAYIMAAGIEYLCSNEVGQPLRGRLVWPGDWILGLEPKLAKD